MKKSIFKWVLPMVAIPMLMASCNSDEPRPEIQQYVTIDRVGVGELQTRSEITTTDNYLNKSAGIQLWFDSGKDDARYNASKMVWTCDGSKWSSKTPLLWGGGSAKYVAICSDLSWHSYYQEFAWQTFYGDNRFMIDASRIFSKDDWLDLLVAQGTATDASLDLKFTHAFAKVKINTNIPSSEATYEDGKLNGIYTSALCSVSVTEGLKYNFENDYLSYGYLESDLSGEYCVYETLVIPQSADALSFSIRVGTSYADSKEYIVKFDNTQTFEAGKIYEYDVVLGDSKAELKNITVSQWDVEENAGNFVTE